jgi:SAM-dependent methyltransferase
MTTAQSNPANTEQVEYWNETAGPKWVRLESLLDKQIAPFGKQVIDRAKLAVGERVLDVGCGCGATSLEIARRVGASGAVTGIDISRVMLERARSRAREAGLTNLRFEDADAQTHAFPPASFDVVCSRFGVMFFADPEAAFRNLLTALRPGGRLSFVCWRALGENPWMLIPLMAAAQHVTMPAPPAPEAPGPFAFGDRDRVQRILSSAGFAGISIDAFDERMTIAGGALDGVVDFMLEMGPTAALLRDAPPEAATRVPAAVRAALAPFETPEGVRMESGAWLVTARR